MILISDQNNNQKPDTIDRSFALGRQLTIEYYDCDPVKLLSKSFMETALVKAAQDSNATIISSSFHNFEPQGVSGVVIIAESHFTVHAWPEHNYAAVDIFTCGDSIDLEKAIDSIKESLNSGNVVISSDQNRGLISKHSETKSVNQALKETDLHPISWRQEYDKKQPWGMLTSIDIYDCDSDTVSLCMTCVN